MKQPKIKSLNPINFLHNQDYLDYKQGSVKNKYNIIAIYLIAFN